ncbi:ribosomal oxygenase 1 [Amia ocellicauda]|uniref:ribosomal oxygenase 1 n=1 Tax=Amia ocellicauda TaxID=2972642 RepID=UPI0034643844
MGEPRVSAFAIYKTLTAKETLKTQVSENGKRKENGIQFRKNNKAAKRKMGKPQLNEELLQECKVTLTNGPCTEKYESQRGSQVDAVQNQPGPCRRGESKNKQKQRRLSAKEVESGSPKPLVGPPLETLLEDLGRVQNSRERASKLFEWLLYPIPPRNFFSEIWEKKPALIRRHNPDYYKGLFSTAAFDRILRDENVQFGVNLDVTSYTNGKRQTHNPPGRALPYTVWDFYKSGCSLRLLNPQSFNATVWSVLSILQEHFGSMAGANVYLTPPGTQGFAPHYDDIEAFVVQLEGKKHWRVYNPRSQAETLPQFSSPNFSQEEIGEPVLEVVLEAGDLLYFPRGFIHQGDCLPDAHSLHITISSYQRNSWGDLLEKLVPAALQVAIEEDVEFREGLPLDYLTYMGVQHSEKVDPRRSEFTAKVKRLFRKMAEFAPVDAGVDQKAKDFLHDCLPPALTEEEKVNGVHGARTRWEEGDARYVTMHMTGKSRIRLIREGVARLCSEGGDLMLYHTVDNSRVYHKEEPQCFQVEDEYADAVDFLIRSYPKFVAVDSLPCDCLEDKVAISKVLFEKGLIITKEPLLFS